MSKREESQAWFARAQRVLPGGVNSPVRAFKSVGGTPLVIRRAHGATIVDVDGNEYLDFVGSWGPLILGHAHPQVLEAIGVACAQGTSFGAPCTQEIELAELVVASYPGIEQVRFVSSGTEAVMSAVRLARAATGRDLIVKFSGCYHGHADHLLVAAGSGLATFGQPTSAGVPESFIASTRVAPLDDEAALEKLFAADGKRIAAVVIEPVPANNGLLLQRPKFLHAVRALCDRYGALLILDEVISGFRLGPGGAAAHYGLRADLSTFGKIVGGGMPVGAFGGSRALMRHLSPEGSVYQAGTLSGNPVAMAAGLATLRIMAAEDGWTRLAQSGAHLEAALTRALANAPIDISLARLGSLFWVALFAASPPRSSDKIDPRAAVVYARIFHALLARGIALAPSAFEVGFVSLAHRPADIDRFAAAVSEVLRDPAVSSAMA